MSTATASETFLSSTLPACVRIPVGFGNSLPSNYPISLISAKAVIYYTDGTNEVLETGPIDIRPGNPDLVLVSTCNTKCANRIEGTGTGRNNTTQVTKPVARTYLPDPGFTCLTAARFGLIPKAQISQADLDTFVKTGDFSLLVQLQIG